MLSDASDPIQLSPSFDDHEKALNLIRETLKKEKLYVDPLTLAGVITLSFVERGLSTKDLTIPERVSFAREVVTPSILRLSKVVEAMCLGLETQPKSSTKLN